MSIIKSLLDNDLYKFTMQRAVLGYKQNVPVEYVFSNRRKEAMFNDAFMRGLRDELEQMAELKVQDDQMAFFEKSCPFLGHEYFDHLYRYRFNPKEVSAALNKKELEVGIAGTWERTILWEVPLMAVISELFFIHCDNDWTDRDQEAKLAVKSQKLQNITFTDFGTRRRRNFATQDAVVAYFKEHNKKFMGTSNVHLAHKHNVRPIGTMAHEWIMGISVLEGLRHANRHAMTIWSNIYKGELGTALTDTFGTDVFWADFNVALAKLFDGPRHDSNCPFKFTDKAVANYTRMKIDPTTKTAIFSDGLDTDGAVEIDAYCNGKIRSSFGIGTHLTNDFIKPNGEVSKPLNMVIKLSKCDGIPVVKLSDTPGKAIGEKDALRDARWTFSGQPLDAIL